MAAAALAGCVAPAVPRRAGVPEPVRADPPAFVPPPTAAEALRTPALGLVLSGRLIVAAGIAPERLIAARTLFLPTDAAWADLRSGTVEALGLPGNRPSLLHLLRYWSVPERLTYTDLRQRAAAAAPGEPVRLPTLDGEPLLLTLTDRNGGKVPTLTDASGRRATVDVEAALTTDGAVIAVDGVIAPRSITPGASSSDGRPSILPHSP